MTSVFIAGSRALSKLNSEVRDRIDCILAKNFKVLVGDANGMDKAVQKYLHEKSYSSVEVFCAGKQCRNNIGEWPQREVDAPNKKGFEFYSAKDAVMADEATYGFMIWDGESVGTLMNMQRLIKNGKKVVVYISPEKNFTDLKSESEWELFLKKCPDLLIQRLTKISFGESRKRTIPIQISFL